MQKRNIPMDRAQRVDEENGVICLVIFSPRVIVIKMSKMAHFLYFLLITVVFFYISPLKRLFNFKVH